ncbi:MAG: hypothetical protein ABS34_12460 [Opitutaceae bacterium BACL24 MAG-120322-bin51]|nr:MAG: hypothetical protein ABS34_12460 [Opitutaceae bacterium BACL24 MAG-120322-bin51]
MAGYSTLKELRFQDVSLHSSAISLKASISAAENNRPPTIEIALCTGKKLFDKRETLKKKISMREAEREMRHHK